MSYTFYFKPKNGRREYENPALVKKILAALPPRRYVEKISEYRKPGKKRSVGLNAYYWGVVVYHFCLEWYGPPPAHKKQFNEKQLESVHNALGNEFRKYKGFGGLTFIRGTSTFTGREMWSYIDQCYWLYSKMFPGGGIPGPGVSGYLPREETENDEPMGG